MFTKSIRGRMLLWLAFLLVCILAGFGITAYQLHRTNRFRQIDEELSRRLAAISSDIRPPFGPRRGGFPGIFEPHRPWREGEFPPNFMPPPERLEGTNAPPGEAGFQPPFPLPEGGPRPWPAATPPAQSEGTNAGRLWFDTPFGPREIRLSARTLSMFGQTDTNDFYYSLWSPRGAVLGSSSNAPSGLEAPPRPENSAAIQGRTRDSYREVFQYTGLGDCLLVGRTLAPELEALRHFAWLLVAAGAAVLLLGLGGGWLVAGRALGPVRAIGAAASHIAAGRLSERIEVAGMDAELGRLAAVLNNTFARLESAFAQQKQFTADASHELRTPIAVIISEAQATLARERTAPEYRETVEACLEAAQQMRRLTRSLLELARYDAGQIALERERFDLAEQARWHLELLQPLAREKNIRLHAELAPVFVQGDPARLGQVISNLFTNAIHYNRNDGEIWIECRAEQGCAVFRVSDSGIGISPQDLPQVFKRFYRADPSRSQAEGHYGLGLAICKAIVDAHGGTIGVESPPGKGARFTVKLPL